MLSLVKYNLKIIISINYFIGWIFLLLLPVFLDFGLRSETEVVQITERFFILVGIIWFCNLFNYEKASNSKEIVYQFQGKKNLVFITRLAFMIISVIIALYILLIIAYIQGANFVFIKLLFGSSISAFVLGLVALLFAQITQEVVVGYLISFAYYYFELTTKGLFTGKFYLFGLISDIPYNKLFLTGVCLILIFINWRVFIVKEDNPIK